MTTKEIVNKNQSEEKQIVEEEYEYVTIPPDGGFGWVIAIAAMVHLVIISHILFYSLAL